MHAAIAPLLERDLPVHECEDGVVAADADIDAGLPARAALADDDVAGDDGLTAEFLDAEAAAFGIAAVADEPPAFLCAMA